VKPIARNKHIVNGSGYFHAVRFYYDSDGLSQIVADFIAEGLNAGEPAVIVATSAHSARIETLLATRGFNVASLKRSGDLFVKDAATLLSQLTVDGMPHPERFRYAVGPVIEKAAGESTRMVRVYGEMVDILWKAGAIDAAAQLEALWNGLSSTHAFVLLCAYSLDGIGHTAHISEICAHHTHVVSANGDVALTS
jgi:MEDS: MEthanogen/methylotroph, DcmR Sensory domain